MFWLGNGDSSLQRCHPGICTALTGCETNLLSRVAWQQFRRQAPFFGGACADLAPFTAETWQRAWQAPSAPFSGLLTTKGRAPLLITKLETLLLNSG